MKTQLAIAGGVALALLVAAYWVKSKLPAAANAINPTNPNNVISQEANDFIAAATGNPNQTVGGSIFDFFNPNAGLAPGEAIDPATGAIIQTK